MYVFINEGMLSSENPYGGVITYIGDATDINQELHSMVEFILSNRALADQGERTKKDVESIAMEVFTLAYSRFNEKSNGDCTVIAPKMFNESIVENVELIGKLQKDNLYVPYFVLLTQEDVDKVCELKGDEEYNIVILFQFRVTKERDENLMNDMFISTIQLKKYLQSIVDKDGLDSIQNIGELIDFTNGFLFCPFVLSSITQQMYNTYSKEFTFAEIFMEHTKETDISMQIPEETKDGGEDSNHD